MEFRSSLKSWVTLLVVMIFAATLSFGQGSLGGKLRGVVTDPSTAVVANAKVSLNNPFTGASRTITTGADGVYDFGDVPAGDYELVVEGQGFRSARFSNVTIELNQVRALNVQLVLGAQNETVTVSGEAVSVVPQETTLRGLVDSRRIEQMPLNGRDFQQLVFLSPGIARNAGGAGQGSGFSTAGARPTTNNFTIDGGDVNDPSVPFGVGASIVTGAVPLDAVQEFSVITSNATAEFGRSSGSTVNVVSKSGTNNLHGSIYEYFRNDILDSRGFFDPVGQKSPLKQNQFGFRLGGPLLKNKTFYSVSYDGFRSRSSFSSQINAPTASFIAGVTNPLWKSILQNAYPAVSGSGITGTATKTIGANADQDTGWIRLDHQINDRQSAFLTFNIVDYVQGVGSQGGNGVPGTGVGDAGRAYSSAFQHSWTLAPNKINTFRMTYGRIPLTFPLEATPQNLLDTGKLRTSGPFAGQSFSPGYSSPNGFPFIQFQIATFSNMGISNGFPQGRISNTFSWSDSFAWTRGKHEMKFGGEYKYIQEANQFDVSIRPVYTIADTSTANLQAGTLLNVTQQAYLFNNTSKRYFRYRETGLFAQDSWRVTPKLTIDLGLRYELNLPTKDATDALSNLYVFNNGKPDPCAQVPFGAGILNTAVVNPAKFGIDMFCTDKNNFAPRAGFAYDIFGNGKTVLRASYGVFYDRAFGNVFSNARFSPPYVVPATSNGGTIDGHFPFATFPAVVDTTTVFNLTTIDPAIRTPYTQRWQGTISRELDKNSVLNLSYVGSKGTKLLQTLRPNFGTTFDPSFRPTNQGVLTRSQSDINAGIIRGPFGSISDRESNAGSNFNSLQVEFNHRYSHGLSFQTSYTWSHSLDSVSDEIGGATQGDTPLPQATLNNLLAPLMAANSTCVAARGTPGSAARLTAAVRCAENNPALTTAQAAAIFDTKYIAPANWTGENYGDSAFDIRHRIVASVIYELPIGRGKWLMSDAAGFREKAFGGWSVNTIFDAQTGTTQPLNAGVDANKDGDTNDRAVATGDLSLLKPGATKNFVSPDLGGPIVQYFGCQQLQSDGSFNNTCPLGTGDGIISPFARLSREAVRQPGLWNVDFQVEKATRITERINMKFRAEFFNLFNNVNFQRPRQAVTSGIFGQILTQRFVNVTQSRNIQFGLRFEF